MTRIRSTGIVVALALIAAPAAATPASDVLPIVAAGGRLYAITGSADALPPHWHMVSLGGGPAPSDQVHATAGTRLLHVGGRRALERRERVTVVSGASVCVGASREEVVLALGEQREDRILVHDRHLFRALLVTGCDADGPSVARVGRHDQAHVEGPDAGGGFVVDFGDGPLRVRETDGVFTLREEGGAEVTRTTPLAR